MRTAGRHGKIDASAASRRPPFRFLSRTPCLPMEAGRVFWGLDLRVGGASCASIHEGYDGDADAEFDAESDADLAIPECRNLPMKLVSTTTIAVLGLSLALAFNLTMGTTPAQAEDLLPKQLLVYYGWPTSITSWFTVERAVIHMRGYEYIILGDGLSAASHPDHANTVAILAHPDMASSTVFGYVSLGVTTQNLPMVEIMQRVDDWKTMGAEGIMFDEFGYDFGTSRARQSEAVDYAHAQGLAVAANAFEPDDAFGTIGGPMNPTGAVTRLGLGDFYLYVSHQVQESQFVDDALWFDKAKRLRNHQTKRRFEILSVTTSGIDDPDAYDETQFFYSWYSALLFGHEATGWGEWSFSASGNSNGQAPYRARPVLHHEGTQFESMVMGASPQYLRETDRGVIQLDTTTHQGNFERTSTGPQDVGELLIYYGWPSVINGSSSNAAAAGHYAQYDYVVLGDGLWAASHPDHANTLSILSDPQLANTKVFGYLDLGVSTQNLTMFSIESRVLQWQSMGVHGIFFDDFGYDFATSRDRQNEAVDFVHAQGMPVIANAFQPQDAFGTEFNGNYNLFRKPTTLNHDDYYLFESHQILNGVPVSQSQWLDKALDLRELRDVHGFKILSITTKLAETYDETLFHYSWMSAVLFGHHATGWGEEEFSATGASNGLAPYRARPTLNPGNTYRGPVVANANLVTRQTDVGLLQVDTNDQAIDMLVSVAAPSIPSTTTAGVEMRAPYPNPFNPRVTISFVLEDAQRVSLTIYNVAGRRVATLADGWLEPGEHQRAWSGSDDRSTPVTSGVYIAVLETASGRSRQKLTLVR